VPREKCHHEKKYSEVLEAGEIGLRFKKKRMNPLNETETDSG
jgi:hypothetical protein